MAMHDARSFLERCRSDDGFRASLYAADRGAEFRTIANNAGFDFSDDEAEDALRAMKLRAEDEFEAAEIDELAQWYRLMAGSSARCSPSACGSCTLCK
jgi:predicted ribosomally synthesized peptide with nif11-like leader